MKGFWNIAIPLLLLLTSLLVVAGIELRAQPRMIGTMARRLERLGDENFLLKQEIHRLTNENLGLQEEAGGRPKKLGALQGRGPDMGADVQLAPRDGRRLTAEEGWQGESDAVEL